MYRVVDGRIEAAICGRREPPRWSLPKGTPDEGESLEETALREVREETGLEAEIEAPLGTIKYWFVAGVEPVQYFKTVHFYLMGHRGGSTDLHDPEFDEARWFESGEALRKLTFTNEAKVLERALSLIRGRTSTEAPSTGGV